MGKVKDATTSAVGCSLGAMMVMFYLVAMVGGILFHLLTVFMMYTRFGVFWAFVGFVAPVLSEIFMVLRSWSEVGFLNGYFLMFVGLVILSVLPHCVATIATLISDILEKREAN